MTAIVFDHAIVESQDVGTESHRTILGPVNLALTERRIGIIGSNGSGKSTLLRLINGLEEPSSGEVTVDGLDVSRHAKEVRRRVGFIFSDADTQIIMPKVRDDIAFSLRRLNLSAEEKHRRVAAALAQFGIDSRAEASPHTLSGGQKQLLALASVLVMEPRVVLADEPTCLLDLANRERIRSIFAELRQTLVVVTHDLELVSDFDRVIWMRDGKIAGDGRPDAVIESYCRHVLGDRP